MRHPLWNSVTAFAGVVALVSCTATDEPAYSYSATIWQVQSENQLLLTANGTTDQKGGYLGHYFGEAVQIMVATTPKDSVVIGAFSISSPTAKKCLPIKKWFSGGTTTYAICDLQTSESVVSIETESRSLTEPLLTDLIRKFVPDDPKDDK